MPLVAISQSGLARRAATWRVSFSGSHSSSSSQKATYSPALSSTPLLRAPARPGRRSALRITRRLRPAGTSTSIGCGSDWSKTITTSISPAYVCSITRRMARCTSTGRSRVAMTTLTSGRASDMGLPLRVAVAELEGPGDGRDDLAVPGGELRGPRPVEAQVEAALVEAHRVPGHGVVDAEVDPAVAEEGEALGGDGLPGVGQDPLQPLPGVLEQRLVAEDHPRGSGDVPRKDSVEHAEDAEGIEQQVVGDPLPPRGGRAVDRHEGVVAGDLGLADLLGPRVGDAAAVAHQVDDPEVDAGDPAEEEGGGGVLGGVDHDPGAGHLADSPVEIGR